MRVLAPLAVAVALAAAFTSPAAAASCSYPQTYPGDNAARESVAGWMAGAAKAAGIPAELPVMASLTDAGLKNVQSGDADSAGYFQMRIPIWNSGAYEGFPDHPTLQRQWFIDQALAIRQQRVAAGNSQFGSDTAQWGEWVADVQRPAAQYRGRYQLRLDEARSLVAAGCTPDSGSGGGGGTGTGGTGDAPGPADPGTPPPTTREPDYQLIPESILPSLSVNSRARQPAVRAKKLTISARCTNEACFMRAGGTIAVPGRGLFKLATPPRRQLKRGITATFELPLSRRLQTLVAASLRAGHKPLAVVYVTAANAGGYRISHSRTVRLVAR
jgi:hypothetical protein